jgi:RND family efflux transporter MFP subunit
MRLHRLASKARFAIGAAIVTAALGAADAVEAPPDSPPPALATALVRSAGVAEGSAHDGVVQAVHQTAIASQVPGAVVAVDVKAGDTVKAGQVLVRLDARAAAQIAAAGDAQAQAARATREAATREFERQRRLFDMGYISQAALDRAEEQHKSARAQADAQMANASAARAQSGFYVVRAPYTGVVGDVAVVLGDMAMPGRLLLTVYDPGALRVSAPVPQTIAARVQAGAPVQVDLPGVMGHITPVRMQWLPMVDPATHTVELRLDLPPGLASVAPGMFARTWLPGAGTGDARLFVPASAVVRRAELVGVYVIGAEGRPLLRQVRLGQGHGDSVEVLSGVAAGESVALDPGAAARVR